MNTETDDSFVPISQYDFVTELMYARIQKEKAVLLSALRQEGLQGSTIETVAKEIARFTAALGRTEE